MTSMKVWNWSLIIWPWNWISSHIKTVLWFALVSELFNSNHTSFL